MSNTPLPTVPKIIKWLFIIFNAFFALCGLVLIGFGGYLVGTNQSLNFLFGNNVIGGGALLIICGIVTFGLAALGVVGALFQLRPLLVIFGISLSVIVVVEIIAAILGFAFHSQLSGQVAQTFLRAMNEVLADSATATAVYNFQESFQCCGANRPEDWQTTPFYGANMNMYPGSCCNASNISPPPPTGGLCNPNVARSIGCVNALQNLVTQNVGVAAGLGVVGLLFGLMEILGIVLSFGLCFCIHRNKLQVV
jgi:CD63 antigen